MATNTDINELVRVLREAAAEVSPQNIDSAQAVSDTDGYIECPHCSGEGAVNLEADYCNYDELPIGVQFYGIGTGVGAAERYFRAASPNNITAILNALEAAQRQVVHLQNSEREWEEANSNLNIGIKNAAARIKDLESNNKNLVERCKLLRERPDLPVDRIPAFKLLVKAQSRIAELEESQPVVSEWISVSDRLPENEDYVLVADFYGKYLNNPPQQQVACFGDWFGDGETTWDDGDGNDLILNQVTHWMPLPAAPALQESK